MLREVTFHRFKQFKDEVVTLRPEGVTLLAGGNNAGKSSVLHGLAVWQFCKTAIEMERGGDAFLAGSTRQGLGLGDDQFSPIDVPSLKHLWTNLATQKGDEPDGYTLKIRCSWGDDGPRYLEFGLSLANDRLFIKATDSNLDASHRIPRLAYLPPFAGITAREMRLPGAIRRRRIGEGLAGAILRNLLLDMYITNTSKRVALREGRAKIRDADLKHLRETDPWELLQVTLRETFSAELDIAPFSEEYHSYISVEVVKGGVDGYKLKRYPNYHSRDLMVEGSGFLQWLSVFALALDPSNDVLLFDEPDAHLHASLQDHLLERLGELAGTMTKQVLIATHSTEILRAAEPESILEFRARGAPRYLRADHQKIGLLAGLGADYAPRLDRLRRTKRLLFVEGTSDLLVLRILGDKIGEPVSPRWVEWRTTLGHKERRQLYRALSEEISDLVAVSLRDRDDEAASSVEADLRDKVIDESVGFLCRKWRRRHIETYLLWPEAIARAAGLTTAEVEERLRDHFAVAITSANFTPSDAPDAIRDLRGKLVLKEGDGAILGQLDANAVDVARHLDASHVPDDIRTFLAELRTLQ
jgi:AAA domain, putative AbiEii toxin, Type IV TA system/AAA domain